MVFAVSSSVATASFAATGASFTAATVIVTVATFESRLPSFALNVKLSGPLQFASGVYVSAGGIPLNVPCVGPLTITYVSGEPSTSVAPSVIALAVSSSVVTASSLATGASLTAV